MSLYTNNNVVTHILDPVYNRSLQRSIFDLPNNAKLLSNMRIGGFGAYANTASTYLGGLGALAVIDSIQLITQDGTVIDQIQNFQLYQSFKQYNQDNQRQKDRAPNLSKSQQATAYGGIVDANEEGAQIFNYNINGGSRAVGASEALTNTGWLSLSDCLNILSVMPVVNTAILKDMRLIINYDSQLVDYITDTANVPFNTTQPFLIVDELITNKEMPLSTVEFYSVEHDSLSVPAIVPTATEVTKKQLINRSLNGFRNKSIQRFLIAKTPQLLSSYQTAGVNMRYGKVASVSCNKETLQISVNGSNLFTGDGLTKENQRLAMLHDSFGVCSTYPFLNGSAYVEADAKNRSSHIDIGNDVISQMDFYGCVIQSEISDLKINWSREGVFVEDAGSADITATASVNQSLVLNCFAQVKKALVPTSDGGFLVQYL